MEKIMNGTITWAEARQIVREHNISEQQFRNWLIEKDAGSSPKEMLELIVNHMYRSTEEHLYAPPHLLQQFVHNFHQI